MVFNESSCVDGKFDGIADLSPGKENASINVRVLRLWKVPAFLNPSQTGTMEMVLVDHKGAKIHATIRKGLVSMFDSKIEEGQVYNMSYFSIFPQSGSYRTTLHPYKLVFHSRTMVELSKSSDITEYGLSITTLAEVCSHTHDYEFLVDVIGLMTGISAEREYVRDGKLTKMIIVELTDHSGKCECALFGDYVDDLSKKMGKSSSGLPVVVIQFAKVKLFRETASLQNVSNTTRIFINPEIPEVEDFKNSIAVHGIDCDSTVPLIGQPPKPSFEEEFLRILPRKIVSELVKFKEDGVFAVCAEVVRIVDGIDWWYPACKCHKAVVPDAGSYFCSSCAKHVFNVVPRFRVRIEVTDVKESAIFVVFDAEMSYIMEKSCSFFVAQSKAVNAAPYPIEFDSLIGKKMLFSIDRSATHSMVNESSYRVKRICVNPLIIDEFCGLGSLSTPTKRVSAVIDVESDAGSDDDSNGGEAQSLEFLKDIIVTPPDELKKNVEHHDAAVDVKKNLNKAFNAAAKPRGYKRLRNVKIEKE
ncbi:replication protein A 70 kDa DNA-binding subunit C [Trifolium repens]|nr:replication protein A 70 kDa DNA-binding subunit C [Trifolium repens]